MKKKRLITRGAAAGVDPNVRNALYLADTANVSEEDIFGNPELMPKLSAALKTITKRKRVKGKPLVELIATVQRDGSLPACVQSNGGSSSSTGPSQYLNRSASAGAASSRAPLGRRNVRPPALVDAIATSNEEYAANLAQAYGSVNRPWSSASAATSVSPALSSVGNNNSMNEDHACLGWGHNVSVSGDGTQSHQWGRQRTPGGTRMVPQGPPLSAPAHHGRGGGNGFLDDRSGRESGGHHQRGLPLQDSMLDSPTSSCTTLVAGTSPGGGERYSPGGSLAGGFSPAAKKSMSPYATEQAARHNRMVQARHMRQAGVIGIETGAGMMLPDGARSAPAAGSSTRPARVSHWGQGTSPRLQQTNPHKRTSTTSSLASTDVESLDTSHLLEFDDDDDDEPSYGTQPYPELGATDGGFGLEPSAGSQRSNAGVDGRVNASAGEPESYGVSPEDLQELEDALLMDSFGVMDELLEGEDIAGPFPDLNTNSHFPDLQNVAASLPPLPRGGQTQNGQRGTPRGGTGSPHLLGQQMFGGASPNHAGSASPVGGVGSNNGSPFPASGNNGAPRPGSRGIGRPRHQVPPRPYTPGKSSRGGSVPWLSHGLGGGMSPRVGSSPRPPTTPGTPHGTQATATGGGRMGAAHTQGRSGTGPSPKSRRRGEEAFPDFGLLSPNEHTGGGRGAPSPKARRVGARAYSTRFPGSPLAGAGLSPRVGFPPQSPRSGDLTGVAPLDGDGNGRTNFPASAVTALLTTSPAKGSAMDHHRSSSNGWGSAPLHDGSSDGGVGTQVAVKMEGAATMNQSWSVRLGEGKNTTPTSASMRQSWGGENLNHTAPSPPPSRRASTSLPNVSDAGSVSVGGVLSSLGTGETGSRWNGRNNNTNNVHNTPTGEVQSQSSTRSTNSNGHHQLQRRHSAPTAPLVQSASAEWRGDACVFGAPDMKNELTSSMLGDGTGEFSQSYESSAAGITEWAPPPPPPSPMTDQFDTAPASAQPPPASSIADDKEGAWWAPLGRISSGMDQQQQQSHCMLSDFGEAVV